MFRELLIIHPDVVWVLIPLVAIIGGFITRWQRENVRLELARAGSTETMQEIRDSIMRLEARVSNLERAVTTADAERKYAL
jgi:hypothetical protein